MFLTNVVCSADLRCSINLSHLCQRLTNVKFDPSQFSGLVWQHKTIGVNCLLFSNGKINCNGKAESFKEGIKRLRRYARYLLKMGYDVSLNNVKVLTASAFHAYDGNINASVRPPSAARRPPPAARRPPPAVRRTQPVAASHLKMYTNH